MKKMGKKAKAVIAGLSVVAVVGVSGIIAYLTDTDTASNKFTVGQVKIDLQEDSWDNATDTDSDGVPDFAENLVPNKTVAKDPKVKNVGKNNAYVYLKVKVPVATVITANANGTLKNNGTATKTPLFSYTVPSTSKWKQIASATDETDAGNTGYYTYVYYYNEAVAPNATTATLFDTVTFANIVSNDPDAVGNLSEEQIDIEAYAIQSDELPANTTIEGAYAIYMNQNS
ncbi:MAG: SipW-dependent-type signal peptide-containing protein [Clostridia bacterium]|nr:SipW-dependent-type signal peptide-containing protein [Clostridia bacterium]